MKTTFQKLFQMVSTTLVVALLLTHSMLAQAGLGNLVDKVLGHTPPPPRLTVFLIDRTGSITKDDQLLYKQAIDKAAADLSFGDRSVVADISGLPISQFHTTADISLPPRSGRRFDDERATTAARSRLQETASSLIGTTSPGSGTYILDTLGALKPTIDSARKAGMRLRILMMTDGTEQTREIDLTRASLAQAKAVVARRKQQNLLPDLNGTEVIIVGAGGENSGRYAMQETFWRGLVEGQNGQLVHYGRTVPIF